MTGPEIKAKFDSKMKEMQDIMELEFFTLNKRVLEIREEIDDLQNNCPHEYDENGSCIYCRKEKE